MNNIVPTSMRTWITLSALAGLMAPAALALRPVPEGEIDDLEGHLYYGDNSWELKIEFEIEIEYDDFDPRGDEFALILGVSNDGRPIRDEQGKPLELSIPLDEPTKQDKDELEFSGAITAIFERTDIDDPKRVRIMARLVRLNDDRTLAVERTKVKFKGDHDDHRRAGVSMGRCSYVMKAPFVNFHVRW